MAALRIFSDVSVWPRWLIASRWKLCSEGKNIFVFSENLCLVLYPESFFFLKIFHWRSWMRHIYGYTLSFFKAVLRIFSDVSVWPWCFIASRWKLCSEGENLFLFSENVSLVLYPQTFTFWKSFPERVEKRHIFGYTLSFFKAVLWILADVSVWPRCLITSRWKLCSEGENLFVFSENVSLALYAQALFLWKVFYILRNPGQSLMRFMWIGCFRMLFFSLKHFLSFCLGFFRRLHIGVSLCVLCLSYLWLFQPAKSK